MRKEEIKQGQPVIDRWYIEYGTGIIQKVKKTVFQVAFEEKVLTYDFPHAQFLDKV